MAGSDRDCDGRPGRIRRICVFARLWEPGLGDLMQRNIFLALLRRACPQAEVVHIVGRAHAEQFAEFFAGHSYATGILTCPDYGDDDQSRWREFLRELAAAAFDCCVVDPDSRGLGAEHAARCGIGIRIGFATGGREDAFLTEPIRLPRPIFGLPDLFDYAQGFARALGMEPPGVADVVPPFRYRREPVRLLPAPVVAIHPGGAPHWNRRWPLDRYGALCRALASSDGASFVLLGAANEKPDLCALRDAAGRGTAAVPVEICAGESLSRLASVIEQADVLVGNDSAPAHVAAALGIPSVVLYGPGVTEFLWTRVYRRHHGINRHYDCQTVRNLPRGPGTTTMPCRFSCHYPYVSAEGPYPRCLTDIEVDEVHRAVRSCLTTIAATPAASRLMDPA
ncbi:MAG TPA: glycosyltransferase family 9 protein [Streptosporangiaceae bacterium]|nr:glycosyltransferase family 9 protein [Streptosporangiaceae bacterium]